MGRVRGVKDQILTQNMTAYGYPYVALGYAEVRVPVHLLVLETFVGPANGRQARHIHDVKIDNRLSELAWGTRAENQQDAVRNKKHVNAKKTHCHNGHEFTTENTRWREKKGKRYRACRKCQREKQQDRRSK